MMAYVMVALGLTDERWVCESGGGRGEERRGEKRREERREEKRREEKRRGMTRNAL